MQQTSLAAQIAFPPPPIPGRRVLLDKSPNASIHPAKLEAEQSPSVRSSGAGKLLSPIRLRQTPVSATTGRKRPIDEVDDQTRPLSQLNSLGLRRGPGFSIYDENFSPGIDHSFPPLHEPFPDLQTGDPPSSCPHSSLSSLLNLSSDSDKTSPLHEKPRRQSIIPAEPAARKAFIQSKARVLFKTVRRAMEKSIKNNNSQLDRRLSDLEGETNRHFSGSPRLPSRKHSPSSGDGADSTPKARKMPRLLPPVEIVPRSTPSKPDTDTFAPSQPNQPAPDHGSSQHSSPNFPSNTAPEDHPTVQSNGLVSVEEAIQRSKQTNRVEAVDGLLRLMRTTKEYDALDTWSDSPENR